MTAEDAIRSFEEALRSRKIIPPSGGIVSYRKKIERCAVEGTPNKKDAGYIFFPDPPISGGFQNWRDGEKWENWTFGNGNGSGSRLSAEEVRAAKARQEQIRQAREQERIERQTEAAAEARKILDAAGPADPSHPYLAKKKIKTNGLREDGKGILVVPMTDETGSLVNLQRIDGNGAKRFLPGGKAVGAYSSFGPTPDPGGSIVIAEGVSTGLSVFEATGLPVVAAMSADNLPAVAKIFRTRYPKAKLIIFADNDTQETHGHTRGIEAAEEAARATGASIAISPTPGDDANDLYVREGAEAVRAAINAVRAVEREKKGPEAICYETLNPTTAAELIASDIPDPEPLIDGLIYPETVLVVGGLVKARKTWLAVLLALCGVSSADFLGHAIRQRLRVLYIGGEGSDRTIRKRLLLAVGYIPGLEDGDLENLGVVSSLGRVKLDTPAGEEWLQRVSEGYDVVIIDPYYRFLSIGSENDHADQRAIFDVLDRLKAKGKAIVLVHHLRKPQGTDAGAAELRGAGLDGYADSILLLSRKKTGENERFALKYVLRHDEEPDALELSPHGPLLQVATPLPPKVTAEDLIDAIIQGGGAMSATDLKRAAKESTDAAKHEVDEAIVSALKEKKIGWRPKPGRGQGRMYFVR